MRQCVPLVLCLLIVGTSAIGDEQVANARRPASDVELEKWLQNMVWHHRFSAEEVRSATGLSLPEIKTSLDRFGISPSTRPRRSPVAKLLTLPYPGGRHPRIGFLEGALEPQRETKVSVFAPWDTQSYVVLDIPEAIWSNLGLTYLAHTHIPTIWDQQDKRLERLEWQVAENGILTCVRSLPNGIEFGTRVEPKQDAIRMTMWLTNGSDQRLTDLRVQNCVMLKAAQGFNQQTNDNKVFRDEFVACHSPDRSRWIITAWSPNHRGWANAPCPCLHSDPKFPDCLPGETKRLTGWLSFHEGTDIDGEIARIKASGWLD